MSLLDELKKVKVVPVAVFDEVDDSLRVAELLLENNISLIEITMRTERALQCIKALHRDFPDLQVGAGSVLSQDMLQAATDRGACFAVSPGFDAGLVAFASSSNIPFIPGIATPTEMIQALEHCTIIKIFPASVVGGVSFINALAAPFALKDFHLMPTGGINVDNYLDYLAAKRVAACGMSWMVDRKLLKEKNFDEVAERIRTIKRGLNRTA